MTTELRLWLRLVPAFAAGYFLSYGLRTVNAVIAPELTRELSASAADLGLLTSAYFLAFGLFQLPLGLLLDRFGPRRVEAGLLMVAAVGCACFGLGRSLPVLAFARALIGLGVSACLMASLKAFSQWFPPDRLASLTGTIMVAGGIGALCASVPVEAALPILGWRGVFFLLAGLLALVSAFLLTVPDKETGAHPEPFAAQLRGFATIFRSRAYWRFAPLGCSIIGGFMAIQGLWAVPWMIEVGGATRSEAANLLFLTGVAMLAGFLFVAVCAGPLARRGVSPMMLLSGGMGLALVTQLAIVLDLAPPVLLWSILGASFSLSNVSYSQLTARFPLAMAGRVNTALNLLIFAGAFGLQWGFGGAVEAFAAAGLARPDAFRATYAGLLLCQALAYAWFMLAERTVGQERLCPQAR